MNEWSIRVTPPSGAEVDFIMDEFEQFIACKEIGKKHKKLHYHIYCKTTLNDTEIREYLQLMCDTNATGNGFASCKPAHDGTKGYCVKEQTDVDSLTHYKGFSKQELIDLFAQSKQYRDSKEAERKAKQRKEEKTIDSIIADVVAELPDTGVVAADISLKILSKYKECGKKMPSKSSHDSTLNTIIAHKYGVHNLLDYYHVSFYDIRNATHGGQWEIYPKIFSQNNT